MLPVCLQHQLFPADFTWPDHLAFNEGTQTKEIGEFSGICFFVPKNNISVVKAFWLISHREIMIVEAQTVIIFCPIYAALNPEYYCSHIMTESEVWEGGETLERNHPEATLSVCHIPVLCLLLCFPPRCFLAWHGWILFLSSRVVSGVRIYRNKSYRNINLPVTSFFPIRIK